MYLSELKLWNFRKYSKHGGALDVSTPHLVVPFKKGLNVLIGENDSGKTAIIDAIKIVLRTHADRMDSFGRQRFLPRYRHNKNRTKNRGHD